VHTTLYKVARTQRSNNTTSREETSLQEENIDQHICNWGVAAFARTYEPTQKSRKIDTVRNNRGTDISDHAQIESSPPNWIRVAFHMTIQLALEGR
jgi:hypothetical protein